MKVRRIIIEDRSALEPRAALDMVADVIDKGRISDDGRQYCYLTVFNNGHAVASSRNKASDRFVVYACTRESSG